MKVAVGINYIGCASCCGLFMSRDGFKGHVELCDGDPLKSPCEAFACARQKYLEYIAKESLIQLKDSSTENPELKVISPKKGKHHKRKEIKKSNIALVPNPEFADTKPVEVKFVNQLENTFQFQNELNEKPDEIKEDDEKCTSEDSLNMRLSVSSEDEDEPNKPKEEPDLHSKDMDLNIVITSNGIISNDKGLLSTTSDPSLSSCINSSLLVDQQLSPGGWSASVSASISKENLTDSNPTPLENYCVHEAILNQDIPPADTDLRKSVNLLPTNNDDLMIPVPVETFPTCSVSQTNKNEADKNSNVSGEEDNKDFNVVRFYDVKPDILAKTASSCQNISLNGDINKLISQLEQSIKTTAVTDHKSRSILNKVSFEPPNATESLLLANTNSIDLENNCAVSAKESQSSGDELVIDESPKILRYRHRPKKKSLSKVENRKGKKSEKKISSKSSIKEIDTAILKNSNYESYFDFCGKRVQGKSANKPSSFVEQSSYVVVNDTETAETTDVVHQSYTAKQQTIIVCPPGFHVPNHKKYSPQKVSTFRSSLKHTNTHSKSVVNIDNKSAEKVEELNEADTQLKSVVNMDIELADKHSKSVVNMDIELADKHSKSVVNMDIESADTHSKSVVNMDIELADKNKEEELNEAGESQRLAASGAQTPPVDTEIEPADKVEELNEAGESHYTRLTATGAQTSAVGNMEIEPADKVEELNDARESPYTKLTATGAQTSPEYDSSENEPDSIIVSLEEAKVQELGVSKIIDKLAPSPRFKKRKGYQSVNISKLYSNKEKQALINQIMSKSSEDECGVKYIHTDLNGMPILKRVSSQSVCEVNKTNINTPGSIDAKMDGNINTPGPFDSKMDEHKDTSDHEEPYSEKKFLKTVQKCANQSPKCQSPSSEYLKKSPKCPKKLDEIGDVSNKDVVESVDDYKAKFEHFPDSDEVPVSFKKKRKLLIQMPSGDKYSKEVCDGKTVYICKLCKQKLLSLVKLRNHLSITHNDGGEFKCDHCNFTTFFRRRWKAHVKRHTTDKCMCPYCPTFYMDNSSLNRHINIKHFEQSNFRCGQCGFIAIDNQVLTDHMRKHSGELLVCQFEGCEYKTASLRNHREHERRHEPDFVCVSCGYSTSNKQTFTNHLLTHNCIKTFQCSLCSYTARTKQNVLRHASTVHGDIQRYACDQCSFTTSYITALTSHIYNHEGILPFKCPLCSYRSTTSSQIYRHSESQHAGHTVTSLKILDNVRTIKGSDYTNPNLKDFDYKNFTVLEIDEVNCNANANTSKAKKRKQKHV